MAQVGGQPRQQSVDVLTGPIPGDQCAHCECVAQVVDTGPDRGTCPDAGLRRMSSRKGRPEISIDNRCSTVDTTNVCAPRPRLVIGCVVVS